MTGLLMRTVPAGGSVTRDAGTCRTTRHGDGPGWPSPVGCGGDARLAAGGADVPGVRRVGPARPGDMGPAGGSGGAGVAAAMALPDGSGRSPAARAAAVAEGVQVPPGLAGHGVYGLAKPD